jgi:uncharacterized protein YdaU (DUF1376 family)
MSEQTFRSPISKLLAFFQRSRNGWKQKCKEAKKELKSLKTCHAKLKASRDYWKRKAREAAALGTEPEHTEAGPIKSTVRPAAGGAPCRARKLPVVAGASSP